MREGVTGLPLPPFSRPGITAGLEKHALIALAAVTLHDAMQLVRLPKPPSGAKYCLIIYFLPTIGPCLSLAWEALGPLDWSQPVDELIRNW
jgi:hypothetical protein